MPSAKWGRILLVVAVLLGGVAWWLSDMYISGIRNEYKHLEPVVVAAADLSPGAKLSAAQLKVVHIPELFVHSPYFSDVGQVTGEWLVTSLASGQVVRPAEITGGLGLPPGDYALTVSVNGATGGAADLRYGDYVDVIAAYNTSGGNGGSAVGLLLHNALVVSVQPPLVKLAVPAAKLLRLAWIADYGSHMRLVRVGRLPGPLLHLPPASGG